MTLAQLITTLRTLTRDTGWGSPQFAFQEKPVGKNDGVNAVFQTQHENVVVTDPSSNPAVFFDVGSSTRITAGFSVTDAVNGIVAFSVAPAADSSPFQVYYYWYWFTDAEHTQFLNDAGNWLGFADPTTTTPGLLPALFEYSKSQFFFARAASFADKFDSESPVGGQRAGQAAKALTDLGKAAAEEARRKRDDYYKAQGAVLKPASGTATYGIDPGSPIR